jgi:hypothetical protein
MARLDVAVISRDGSALIVNATRPASLVAFEDTHDGKVMPETVREIAFVVHHALGIDEPLDEWLDSLESISALDEDVALARRIIDGDEHAKKIALGLAEPEDSEAPDPTPTDPAIEQVERAGDIPGPIIEAIPDARALASGGG